MDEQFIRDRISSLRQEKQISERKMSLDLGHSTSYIRSITSGRALPSMSEFLYICEYLGVTPMEFFNEERKTTLTQQEAIEHIYSMSDEDIRLLIGFIERMKAGGKCLALSLVFVLPVFQKHTSPFRSPCFFPSICHPAF